MFDYLNSNVKLSKIRWNTDGVCFCSPAYGNLPILNTIVEKKNYPLGCTNIFGSERQLWFRVECVMFRATCVSGVPHQGCYIKLLPGCYILYRKQELEANGWVAPNNLFPEEPDSIARDRGSDDYHEPPQILSTSNSQQVNILREPPAIKSYDNLDKSNHHVNSESGSRDVSARKISNENIVHQLRKVIARYVQRSKAQRLGNENSIGPKQHVLDHRIIPRITVTGEPLIRFDDAPWPYNHLNSFPPTDVGVFREIAVFKQVRYNDGGSEIDFQTKDMRWIQVDDNTRTWREFWNQSSIKLYVGREFKINILTEKNNWFDTPVLKQWMYCSQKRQPGSIMKLDAAPLLSEIVNRASASGTTRERFIRLFKHSYSNDEQYVAVVPYCIFQCPKNESTCELSAMDNCIVVNPLFLCDQLHSIELNTTYHFDVLVSEAARLLRPECSKNKCFFENSHSTEFLPYRPITHFHKPFPITLYSTVDQFRAIAELK